MRGKREEEEEKGGRMPASLKGRWSEGAGRTGGWQDCADGRALVQSMPIRGSHKSWALWAGLCQQSTEWIDFKRHWKKKRKCRREREGEREKWEGEWLFNSPSARSPQPVPPRFSIQDCRWKGGGEKSRNTETVTNNKPTATRPPRVWFKQDGSTQTKYIISNSIQHLFFHCSNFSSQPSLFFISPQEKWDIS